MKTESFEIKNKLTITPGETDGLVPPLSETLLDFFGVISKWRRLIARLVLRVMVGRLVVFVQ